MATRSPGCVPTKLYDYMVVGIQEPVSRGPLRQKIHVLVQRVLFRRVKS